MTDRSDVEEKCTSAGEAETDCADAITDCNAEQAADTVDPNEQLLQEHNDRIKRLQADFDNFRRRTKQEKEELSALVTQNMIKDLLPLLDNFERAIAADAGQNLTAFQSGIEMVYRQFIEVLQKNGLAPIAAQGESFDPQFHEAVMRVEDDSQPDGTVVEELQKGYQVKGRVIRPSMVKVIGH